MKPIIPDPLVAHVVRRNSMAFVGAGLSAGLGLPSWPQLIRQMIDWCEGRGISLPNKADIEQLLNVKGDLLAAANALRARMGDDNYHRFFGEVFLRPDLKPTEVHKLLAKLPFVGAGTTNYDPLLEEAYREIHPDEPVDVFTHVDHEQLGMALNAKRYFVLKAHGTVERPDTIILDTKDYGGLIYASKGYRTFLHAMFLQRTVLFLGFSMTDPDLLSLLRELKVIFEGHIPIHYALMDARGVTQTEQEQFEENYGVKIIPYIPSAADHPEVKAFLIELSEKVTQNAAWYQADELRKTAEVDDPHYRAVFTSDNEFIIKERYEGSLKDYPLNLSITVNRKGHEAIKRTLATGEPLDIKGEDIIDVQVPDIISRFIKITEHLGITSRVARGENKLTVNAVVECADGETVSLDNIVLENIQGGDEQMIVSNESQDVPWKFRQIVKTNEDEISLNFTLQYVGATVKRALEGLRFSRALSKGGRFYFENVETGVQFQNAEIAPGTMQPPSPLLMKVFEALEFIQKKTGVLFTAPPTVSRAEADNILTVERILKTGRIDLNPPSVRITNAEEAKSDVERFSNGATLAITQYADDWVFIILGKHVCLGPVLVSCEKMTIAPEDLEVLSKATEEGLSEERTADVRLVPLPGEVLEAKLLNWLPAEEAEEIRNLPFVKATSLNNTVGLLAESAKADAGTLNVEEFMDFLDAAKGQTSDQGVPLNRLGSATAEELSKALEPVMAELVNDERLRLAVGLVENRWLSSGDAARLAGVEEPTLRNEQSNQQRRPKAKHADPDK